MGVASFVDILVGVAADVGYDDDDNHDAGAAVDNEDNEERLLVVSVVVVVVVAVVDTSGMVVGQHADCNNCVASHYYRERCGDNCVAEVSAELLHTLECSLEELREAKIVAAVDSLAFRCRC